MKTVEELLQPRYKVIADYPKSDFKVGDILNKFTWPDTNNYIYTTAKDDNLLSATSASKSLVEPFPHLFKKLDWHEDRQPEDLPEYVKDKENNRLVYKVHGWLQGNAMFYFGPYETNITATEFFIPATKEEYEQYNQQQKDERSVASKVK